MRRSSKIIITALVVIMAVAAFSGLGHAYTAETVNSGNTFTSEYEMLTQKNYTFGTNIFEYYSLYHNGDMKYFIADQRNGMGYLPLENIQFREGSRSCDYAFIKIGETDNVRAEHRGGDSTSERYVTPETGYTLSVTDGDVTNSTATNHGIDDGKVKFNCIGPVEYTVALKVIAGTADTTYYVQSGSGYTITGVGAGSTANSVTYHNSVDEHLNTVSFSCPNNSGEYVVAVKISVSASTDLLKIGPGSGYTITGYDSAKTSEPIRPYLALSEGKVQFKCVSLEYTVVFHVKADVAGTTYYIPSGSGYVITGIDSSLCDGSANVKYEAYKEVKVGNVTTKYYDRVSFACPDNVNSYAIAIKVKVDTAQISLITGDATSTEGFTKFNTGWRYLLEIYPEGGDRSSAQLFWGKGNGWNRSSDGGTELYLDEGQTYVVNLYFGGPRENINTVSSPVYVACYTSEPIGKWDNGTTIANNGKITYEYNSR